MLDRRTFLKSGMGCSGAVALTVTGSAQDGSAKFSSVDGYDYHLPKLAKGSRLLFLGDSITDMKWLGDQKRHLIRPPERIRPPFEITIA
jgi:hypothetical protein